jgi:hypothetical protein
VVRGNVKIGTHLEERNATTFPSHSSVERLLCIAQFKTNITDFKMKLSAAAVLAFAASASAFTPAFLPKNPETRLFMAPPQGGYLRNLGSAPAMEFDYASMRAAAAAPAAAAPTAAAPAQSSGGSYLDNLKNAQPFNFDNLAQAAPASSSYSSFEAAAAAAPKTSGSYLDSLSR